MARSSRSLAGAAIPSLMCRDLVAGGAHRPGKVSIAMWTVGASRERVEGAAASVGTAGPLHSHNRGEGARGTCDVLPVLPRLAGSESGDPAALRHSSLPRGGRHR